MSQYLIEINYHDGLSLKIGYYTSGEGCIYSGQYYEPRVINPGSLKVMMFGEGTTKGASKVGYGEIKLTNLDGRLDFLLDCGINGRTLMIKELLLTGLIGMTLSCGMEQTTVTENEISIRIKDPQIAFRVPLQTNKYLGDNVLPNGVEGTADIKGKPKPLLYGYVSNATPVCVNTSKLIYQVNDGAVGDIPFVFDKGVKLQAGVAHATLALLQATTPDPGTYDTYLGGGYFRLGSAPSGLITFNGAMVGNMSSVGTAAQIAKSIALRILPSGDLIDQDFNDLDTLNSAILGYYSNSETTVSAALDEVLGSIGGWYGFDASSKMNVGRLETPTGTPSIELSESEIFELDRLTTQDEGRGLPVWKINFGYDRNYTIQDAGSLAGSLSDNLWKTTSLPNYDWRSITYGNGMFVAVGYNSAVSASSPDGITWTQRALPVSANWRAVTFGNGMFVAVGYNSAVSASSPDGITWTQRALPVSANWQAVTYGDGLFVAVAIGGTIAATSPDGITWTQRALPVNADWRVVAFGNGMFVAISTNMSTIAASSPDGITWTQRAMPYADIWSAVAFGNGIFVATASGVSDLSATSFDGITWTQRPLPVAGGWQAITHGGGVFVAVAYNNNKTIVSTDGITWNLKTLPSVKYWYSVAYGNGHFFTADGEAGSVLSITPDNERTVYLQSAYRTVSAEDNTILTVHPLATELNLNSLILFETDAQAEADRQLDLRKVRRDYLAIEIKRSALPTIPELGKIIQLTYPRYGYSLGKLFIVIGYEIELESNDLTIFVWG